MRIEKKTRSAGRWTGWVLALAVVLSGCSMDVDNPSQIQDEDLNTEVALDALRAGVAYDFAQATANSAGGAYLWGALLTDELVHVGTWVGMRTLSDGLVIDDCAECDTWWSSPAQARWVAQDGLLRMSEVMAETGLDPNSDPRVAEVAMYAGHIERIMGGIMCNAVQNYQPADRTVFYEEAMGHFEQAISVGGAAGHEDVVNSARVGLANVYLNMGMLQQAMNMAAQVPTGFVYEQIHADANGVDNMFYWWVFERNENSVWGTPFADWGLNASDADSDGDPRVLYDVALAGNGEVEEGGDNRRPFYRQLKYTNYGAEIALAKGTDARLIEAEVALLQNGYGALSTVVGKINEVRMLYGVDPIDAADIPDEAALWHALMKERGIEFWLEGHRLPDIRRWALNQPGPEMVPFTVIRDAESGAPATADVPQHVVLEADVWQELGDICIKISEEERNSWGTVR